MTVVGQPPRANNFVQRAMNIILRPSSEWAVIDAEPTTVQGLFVGYAMILAAIGPICGFLGAMLFSSASLARFGIHLNPVALLIGAVVNYVVALLAVFVFGLVIDMLAPNFGATRDRVRAMKVAVYSATPAWLCGVFGLVPMLGILGLLGLYGIFLLYKGEQIVMRAPQEKATTYTVVTVLVMLVVWIVLGALTYFVGTATGATPPMAAFMHPAVSTTTYTTTTTTN